MITRLFKIFVAIVLLHSVSCTSIQKTAVTDHYNGKKFHNPTLEKQFSPSFSDIFRMMREGRPQWPKNIENTAIPNIKKDLDKDDMSITFVNHATFLIQFSNFNILTDPVWSKRTSPISFIGPKRIRKPGVDFSDLPQIDVVLISHNHYDHLDKKTLRKLNERFSPKFIVPLGDKKLLQSIGIKDVIEMDWWENIQINPNTVISFTPAQHSSGRGLFDRDKSLWGSYFVKNENHSIYFGGDAGYSTHYADIKSRLGSPDVAMLGIGAYAPQFFMKPVHMNPEEGVQAHKDLGAKLSIGMHIGTFQLASEPFDEPQLKLKEALQRENISEASFLTFKEGETRNFSVNSK